MKKLLVAIFLLASSSVISQNEVTINVGDTLYYAGRQKLIKKKTNSFAIYRGQNKDGKRIDFFEFDRKENNAWLFSKTTSSSIKSIKKNGKEINYHKNGEKKSQGAYIDGKKTGLWSFYFKKGTIKMTRVYTQKGKLTVSKIVDAWDFDGNKTVTNGTGLFYQYDFNDESYIQKGMLKDSKRIGVWEGTKEFGKYYTENYKNGVLTKGTSWDKNGKEYKYKELNVKASYGNRKLALRKFITKNLDISVPKEGTDIAEKRKYYILFKIGKDGTISDVKILGGTKESLYVNGEVRRVFKLMKPWKPGKQRGQLIATKFTLPLTVQYH